MTDVKASFASKHASGRIMISSAFLSAGYGWTAVEKKGGFACVFSALND